MGRGMNGSRALLPSPGRRRSFTFAIRESIVLAVMDDGETCFEDEGVMLDGE